MLEPLVTEFFDWVRAQDDLTSNTRGLVSNALGYADRHSSRFDVHRGCGSEGQQPQCMKMRQDSATGRKAWLSSARRHAEAAATSTRSRRCKIHGLDPERYLPR